MKVVGLAPFYNVESAHYPYLESIISAMPLVDEMIINDGGCLDNTIKNIKRLRDNVFPNIKVIEHKHKKSKMWKGLDESIEYCLNKIDADWIIEVQADEFFHPEDYDNLLETLSKAHKGGYNGLRQNVYHTTWEGVDKSYIYPTMRIIRNKDNIRSFAGGDCFYYEGERMNRKGFQTHNMYPELDTDIPFYHFKAIPMNLKLQARRHKEHYAKNHRNRNKIQKDMQDRINKEGLNPVNIDKRDIADIIPEIYHGLLDYSKLKYTVREELFNKKYIKELGYIND